MKKIFLLFIIITSFSFSNNKVDLYLKAFGIVPDKEYEIKLFVNDKNTNKKIKVISKELTTNYFYNLSILNSYLKEKQDFKEAIIETSLPFKYELELEKNKVNFIIEKNKLKPWIVKFKDSFKADSFAIKSYYHIPISVSYENEVSKVVLGFNYYDDDFYFQLKEDFFRLGYKNYSLGYITSSKYANLSNVFLKGIKYSSERTKNYNNNFSSVYLEEKSIIEIFSKNRRVKQIELDNGYYDFSYLENLDYTLKITELKTNKVSYVKNYLENSYLNFNYDLIIAEEGYSFGGNYNIFSLAYVFTNKINKIKESSIKIEKNQKRFLLKETIKNDLKQLYSELKYKDLKVIYKENHNQIWDIYMDHFREEEGKTLALNYKYKDLYLEVNKNMTLNNYGYSASYVKNDFSLTYKKDTQNFIGFNIQVPLWKEKSNTLKYLYSSLKVDGMTTEKSSFVANFYEGSNDLSVKVEKAEDSFNYDLYNKYKNRWGDTHLRLSKSGNIYSNESLYYYTNIIGNNDDFTFTNQRPILGDSVWLVKNGTEDSPFVYKTNRNSSFKVESSDFDVILNKNNFNLEHKANKLGYINIEKSFNVSCKLDSLVLTSFELFTYSNKDNISKSSFVGLDKSLYLKNVVDGIYTLKFKNRIEIIKIKDSKCSI